MNVCKNGQIGTWIYVCERKHERNTWLRLNGRITSVKAIQ